MDCRGIAFASSVALFASCLYSQEFRAALVGRVLDPTDTPVVNAKVRVTNRDTNETREVVTDSQGNYNVPLLNPGTYAVQATATGFKTAVQEGLRLNVSQTATLDLKLQLGAVSTKVIVTADAPLLNSANPDRGGLVDEESVKEYPLNTRNPFMLAMLTAGVNFDGELTYQRPFDNGAAAEWSINGSQRKNEFLLDGVPNNSQAGGNNIAFIPPVDSVQEFKIQTNTFDAQYGRTGGGIINVALKSGGNRFHGAIYEFARRSAWDANSFQNNSRCLSFDAQGRCQGAPKEGHWLDQYGVQLDGPVYIPWLYRGHDKTFFLFNYEGYREGTPQPLILSMPEPEMRDGDFSRLVDGRGRRIIVYDPLSGRQQGSSWVRDPFPNNIIPRERINDTARKLVQYFPLPNTSTPGVNYSTSNYFISGGPSTARDTFYNLVAKIDQNVGDKQRFFVRFGNNDRKEMRTYNGLFDQPGADGQLPLRRANWTGAADWTSTLNPQTILVVRASMSRYIDPSTSEANRNFDLIGAGFPKELVSQLPYGSWFPRLNISPFQALGRNPNFGASATNTFSLQPAVNYFRGGRTWKAGVDMRWIQYSTQSSGQIMTFSAGDTFTRADYSRSDGSGIGLASWLLGMPTSGSVNINMYPIYMYRYFAPWLQYDWKVNRKLTVNFGIRWDANLPPVERYNRMNRGFDPNVVSPVDAMIDHSKFPYMKFPITGGLLFAGDNGSPRAAADSYLNTFQPRVGIAYALDARTVLRGGWGRYFINPDNSYLQNVGYNASTSLNVSADSNRTALPNLLGNPFPVINQPVGNTRGLMTFAGNGFNFVNTHFETPYADQFSIDIQRAIGLRATLSVAYVGNRGKRLQSTRSFNDDEDTSLRDQCNYLLGATSQSLCTANLANPFRNLPGFEGTAHYTNSTRSRYDLSRPFPQFTSGLTEYMRNDGMSWYNGVQATFNLRAKGSLNLNTNYTFSKVMERNGFLDGLHNIMQQGLSSNDRPHKFVYSMIWQLPVGKGRRFLGGAHGAIEKLLGGWESTAIFQIFSGRPWALPGNVIYLKDARNPDFTWNAPRIQAVQPCVLNWGNNNTVTWQPYSQDYGCTEANWIIVPNYNPRYTPYYDGRVRLQTVRMLDASLNKMTRLTERYSLQFRLEVFNVMNSFFINTKQFSNDTSSTNFGSIIKGTVSAPESNYPRNVQMAVKFIW